MENEKTLIIDKKTNLASISNRSQYTKLVLNSKTNPMLLFGFKNLKEVEINNSYNEKYINSLPFLSNIEKISFVNLKDIGRGDYNSKKIEYKYWKLKELNNIKCIEFPAETNYIQPSYIENLTNLEEIILNVNRKTYRYPDLVIKSPKLKKIIAKTEHDLYSFDLMYVPNCIKYWRYNDSEGKIIICYSNKYIDTTLKINNNNQESSFDNSLTNIDDNLVDNKELVIPEIVTSFCVMSNSLTKFYDTLSINVSLLSSYSNDRSFFNDLYLNKIILRSNNEMNLFQEKKIYLEDKEIINKIFIKDKKLCLEYDNYFLEIDDKGTKEKIIKEEKKVEENHQEENILDKYTLNELEEYMIYRRFIETYKNEYDKFLTNALDVIKDRVDQKLKKTR